MLEGKKFEHRSKYGDDPPAVEYFLPVHTYLDEVQQANPWVSDYLCEQPEGATAKLAAQMTNISNENLKRYCTKLLSKHQVLSVVQFEQRWWLGLGGMNYTPEFWRNQLWNVVLYPEQQMVDDEQEMVIAFGLQKEFAFHELCSHFGGMVWNPQDAPYGVLPPLSWHRFSEQRWGEELCGYSIDQHSAWFGAVEVYQENGSTVLLRDDGATAIYFPISNRLVKIGDIESFIQRFLVEGITIAHFEGLLDY